MKELSANRSRLSRLKRLPRGLVAVSVACLSLSIVLRADAQAGKPLSSDYVVAALNNKLSSKRIAQLAQEFHVDFQVTPELEKQFRSLGATDEVLKALADNYASAASAPPEPKPVTPAEEAAAHYKQGEAFYVQAKWADAAKEYRAAIELKPDYAPAQGALGYALLQQGSLDEAIQAFKEALRLNPANADVHNNLASALDRKGDRDGAIAEYREALKLEPGSYSIRNNLGAALDNKGDVDGAIKEYRETLRLAPSDAEAHNNLGVALSKKGDREGAIAEYRKATDANPHMPEAWYDLGMEFVATQDFKGSLAAFREAVRLKPDWPEAHLNLATILKKMGQKTDALAEYIEAARLNPNNPKIHGEIGSIFVYLGCWKNAGNEFQYWVDLEPRSAAAHAYLGLSLYKSAHPEEALEEYKIALQLDAHNKEFDRDYRNISNDLKKRKSVYPARDTACANMKSIPAFSNYDESSASSSNPGENSRSVPKSASMQRVGAQVMESKKIFGPPPVYPQIARMAGIQGVVKLSAIINENGTIQDLKLISGLPLLVKASMDAVSKWRYQPTRLNGEPVPVETEIDVNFQLEGHSHPSSASGIYDVGGDVTNPIPVYQPPPQYSEEARKEKYAGVVVVMAIIDAEGNVDDVQVLRPLGMGLDEKAIEAVKTWKFKPALRNGVPVKVRVAVEVTFRLM